MSSYSWGIASYGGAITSYSWAISSYSWDITSYGGAITGYTPAVTACGPTVTGYSPTVTSYSPTITGYSWTERWGGRWSPGERRGRKRGGGLLGGRREGESFSIWIFKGKSSIWIFKAHHIHACRQYQCINSPTGHRPLFLCCTVVPTGSEVLNLFEPRTSSKLYYRRNTDFRVISHEFGVVQRF